tara:strand:+ start:12420 stop:13127 length:708 start_codon:yes stop_codon:yes gene_type:complete
MPSSKISQKLLKKIIREELLKTISESYITAAPMYSATDTVLYLFDFDDTLAHTDNMVKVTFVDAESGEVGETESMDSESFETYRQKPAQQREKDIVNYDDFESVLNPVEIKSLIDLVRNAKESENGVVAIITARAGEQNNNDISSFLESKGLKSIPVHTVGDKGGKPEDKLEVVRKYVEDYSPSEIYFYDDSKRNLNAILDLCSEDYPGLTVNTFDVIDGQPVPEDDCHSSDITL